MNLPKNISSKKGFTLIELLIVIGILGILSVGLLAAIDPVEQLRKGRDTARKSIVAELANANARYNGATGLTLWDQTAPVGAQAAATLATAPIPAGMTALVTAGELKSGFQQGITADNQARITVAGAANGDISVCFAPESRSDQNNFQQLFAGTGVGAAVCASLANAQAGNCFFCAR